MEPEPAARRKISLRILFAPPAGAILLCIIVALVILSTLAASLALLTSATALTTGTDNRQARAHYLALSGLNVWADGRTGSFALGPDAFALAQTGPDAAGVYTVTCRATVCPGTPLEANAVATAKHAAPSPISFTANLDDFTTPTVGKTENVAGAITVYAAKTNPSPGHADSSDSGSISLGGGRQNTTGAIWYQGSRGACTGPNCPDGMCNAGKCSFAKGLRATFGFAFSKIDRDSQSTDYGDGFTFTVANATTNDPTTAAGGAANGRMGEYLGYAGPGPSGLGIDAPKLAVEVDVYPNLGQNPPTMFNSRADAGNANHIAVVYWGGSGCYDDNVHGAGSSPANPKGPTTENVGYYEKPKTDGEPNWLEDGQDHTMRLEIHRDDTADGGAYLVAVWIDGTGDGFDDVTTDYTAQSPQIAFTTTLAAADHDKLATVYFGWTEATGSSPQNITIRDFSLEFRR